MNSELDGGTSRVADRRDGLVYVLPDRVELAVRVALATGRPLLLRGEPGSGKSSLAAYVARQRGWRYYELVVTSKTQPRDLLWSFDTVRRLADAQAETLLGDADYVEPGMLWWAYDPDSARRRGMPEGLTPTRPPVEPMAEVNRDRHAKRSVLLIDEIDKADPDVPNGLLVPLGSNEFTVAETGFTVRKTGSQLVVITTNEERELPQAFLRRCVVVALTAPDEDGLVEIARQHTIVERKWTKRDAELAAAVAHQLGVARTEARQRALRPPSTAEFLDAFRACGELGIGVADEAWSDLRDFVLLKRGEDVSA
ncbi:AAA family ATPase [Thermoactinospora rubra]|uniref:AAA family ATPase n=1 Tax=Thermoactinospora rubra TaxID=1088767 RepID=UPI000A10BB37|nr:MoxR family ATPase [Thermoactinospora rubra]